MSGNTSGFIQAGTEKLHYISFGTGDKLLLAFHGYGDNGSFFLPFEEYLQIDYTVISIELPHHGNCQWPEDKYLDITEVMDAVHNLKNAYKADKIHLMGYSIGGRVCLKIIEEHPEIIGKAILMASDGLTFNPMYYFVTKNFIGKKMFERFMSKPDSYLSWIEFARRRNWVSEARYKLAVKYLHDADSRNFLQKVWPCMSLLIPDVNKVKKQLNAYAISLHIFMGRHDVVIPVTQAESFCKGLDTAQLHVLNKAHRLFDGETIPQIAASLL